MDKLAREIIDVMKDKQLNTSIDDYPTLKDTLLGNEFADELVESLTNADTIKSAIEACGDKEVNCNKFSRRLAAEKRRQRNMVLIRTLSAAAVLTAVALFVYYTGSESEEQIVAQVTTVVEGEKPMIVLSNGECVDLADNTIKTENFEADGTTLKYTSTNVAVADKVEYNTLIVPSKYTFHVTLSDKTEVFLNANSRLKYPVTFTGDTREVTLTGEGYFKVTKSQKPFIVNAEEISVKVYGTEFNVNTNKQKYIETLLVTGSVGITNHDREVMMKPNQLYVLNTVSGESTVDAVDAEDILAWRDGMFRFTNKPLESILDEIGAWYGLRFTFENGHNKDILFNMSLFRTAEVNEILEVLEASAEITFIKKDGGEYLVK